MNYKPKLAQVPRTAFRFVDQEGLDEVIWEMKLFSLNILYYLVWIESKPWRCNCYLLFRKLLKVSSV